ncbi:MAG TPA: N-6 DNA methylase [bacterium]|nr:N-6 DNA methylase [bacterium]
MMIKNYIKKIFDAARHGDTREESYYSCLESFLQEYASSMDRKNIHITTLPKKTEAGNPDFRVWDGRQSIVGYIEAKKPTESNLDAIEDTGQLRRYLSTFPNLVLTNFFEFRLYRNGQLIDRVSIARPFIIHRLRTVPPAENTEEFLCLLEKFFSFSLPRTYTAKTLAVELAKRTRFLKEEVVAEELKEEEGKKGGFLTGFYEAFKKYLITGLDKDDFADLYSQTIAYGLFAARTRCENGFNRKTAVEYIPETIGILKEMFQFVSLGRLPAQMEWTVDDISGVLAAADVKQILHKFYSEGKGADPIIHFYETFLAQYDPAEREKRGVYYTPVPVVSYIVRSLDILLREEFDRQSGFASRGVTVLDPACGTGTFLAEAVRLSVENFSSQYGSGGKRDFVKRHVLENFYGFELMMAPYAVGHLKLSFLLEELGCPMEKDERFRLYLANTLETDEPEEVSIPGLVSLTKESHLAGEVKSRTPILAILGNPPYSGHSLNRGEWISREIKEYFQVDGKPLGEKNPKWLQDDYVKFIRFAQWKIEQDGEGLLGFITNHGYLDNPTFRGMRQSLMKTFNSIYILDLHGNSLKKEVCPDGGKDENVFDIRQGVAVALFVKKKGEKGCSVFHSELWGLREEKYEQLLEKDIKTVKWKKLSPKSGYYLFVPRDEKLLAGYDKFLKINEIFKRSSLSIQTHRDNLVIDFNKKDLQRRMDIFRNLSIQDEFIKQSLNLKETKGWALSVARKSLSKDENLDYYFTEVLYRPFDTRWILYHERVVDRVRKMIMRNMFVKNIALLVSKQQSIAGFYHAFISDKISESCVVSNKTKEGNYHFPLYLYPEGQGEKVPNISPELIKSLSETYGEKPSPEDIFYYIYAVLYSETYRRKYAEFLKIDFPRIPFTKDYALFMEAGGLGKKLVELHLLKSTELDNPFARFQGNGENRVEKLSYSEKEKRVYINASQYFEGVEKDAWLYQVGGYRVMEKWLKDRKGRTLSYEDIIHYCKIASALSNTISIQQSLESLYPRIEHS